MRTFVTPPLHIGNVKKTFNKCEAIQLPRSWKENNKKTISWVSMRKWNNWAEQFQVISVEENIPFTLDSKV